MKPLVMYKAPWPTFSFASPETAWGPSTMAQKAYVSFGYLFRMKYTDCLSFSSLNGRIAAAKSQARVTTQGKVSWPG